DDADAPTEREQLMRTGLMRGTIGSDITAQLLNLLADPEAEGFPPITPPKTPSGGAVPSPEEQAVAALLEAALTALTQRQGAAPFPGAGSGSHRGGARGGVGPSAPGHRR